MRILKILIIFIGFVLITSHCYCQSKTDFYNKQKTIIELRKSILSAIKSYENKEVYTDNISVLMSGNYFDSLLFYNALDTLTKYDRGKFLNYYIVIFERVGDPTTAKVCVRGYSKIRGKQVIYYLIPPWDKGKIFTIEYLHNKCMFKNVYEKMKNIKGLSQAGDFDVFSISIFKNKRFETKLFKANNLPPDYFEKIHALFGDDF